MKLVALLGLLAARPAFALEAMATMSGGRAAGLAGDNGFTTQLDPFIKNARFGQWDAGNDMTPASVTAADAVHEVEFACGCGNDQFQFWPKTWDARTQSNKMAEDGSSPDNVLPLSNLWWVWGQFMVHDQLSSVNQLHVDDPADGWWEFKLWGGGRSPAPVMKLKRLLVKQRGKCRVPLSAATPELDLSTVYSDKPDFLRNTLREPGESCRLAVGPGDLLPLTESKIGGSAKFVAAVHTLFVRVHNWACDLIESTFDGRRNTGGRPYYKAFTMEDRFDRARNATVAWAYEMTRQWLDAAGLPSAVLTSRRDSSGDKIKSAAVSAEFAFAAARTIDDMVPNKIGSESLESLMPAEDYFGVRWQDGVGQYDVGAATKKLDRLLETLASTPADALDGKISDAMRNAGGGPFGIDMAAVNIWRAREVGVKSYQQLAACFGTPVDEEIASKTSDPWAAMALENANTLVDPRARHPFGPLTYAVLADQYLRSLFTPAYAFHWRADKFTTIKGYEKELLRLHTGHVIRMVTGADVDDNPFLVSKEPRTIV